MDHYTLKLYVTGRTAQSLNALQALERICMDRLPGRHAIDFIDLLERPDLAADASIIVTPTVVREHPLPERRVVGDFSSEQDVVMGLQLPPVSRAQN